MYGPNLIMEIVSNVEGAKGCLVLGEDGLVLASNISEYFTKEDVSALSLAMISETNKQNKRIKRGEIKNIILETDETVFVVSSIVISSEKFITFTEFSKFLDISYIMTALEKALSTFK